MTHSNDSVIIMTALAVAIGSYFGWLVFTGLNELIPALSNTSPFIKIAVGLAGLFVLVKLGMRKQ